MKKRTNSISFFVILAIPIIMVILLVVIVDPFFHYHKPISGLSYYLSAERYQNDGIARHFEYDAVISGSSETQNFRTSEFDELWNTNAIKVSYDGGAFKEVDSIIRTALASENSVKYVLRSLDFGMLNADSDVMAYTGLPEYLYDSNPFNDYKYIFNLEVLLRAGLNLKNTLTHEPSTSFDEYGSFYKDHPFSRENVLANTPRMEIVDGPEYQLSEDDRSRIQKNISKNIIATAKENPDVTFYYFIPVYSVCVWDAAIRTKQLDYMYETVGCALDLMFDQSNIRVFSYSDHIEITSNLDNYMDGNHYSPEISSWILEMMAAGEGELTRDNYKERLEAEKELYRSFDYESVYAE